MIRPLRRRHRVMMAALATALVIIFLAGVLVRPAPEPVNKANFYQLPVSQNPAEVKR